MNTTTAIKACTQADCAEPALAKGLCRKHYDAGRSGKPRRIDLDDLMDRASIALEIAYPEGLLAEQIGKEVGCGTTLAYQLPRRLVAEGYARTVQVGRATHYVWVKSYPSSE